jgi:hypothetical protein
MVSDVVDAGTFVRVVRKEAKDEILEFSGETLAVDFLEVEVGLTSHKEVVEVLFLAGFFEGEDALNNDEEYNPDGE